MESGGPGGEDAGLAGVGPGLLTQPPQQPLLLESRPLRPHGAASLDPDVSGGLCASPGRPSPHHTPEPDLPDISEN